MKISLGLDIGTSSIGFALVDMNSGKIIEANSVIFDKKETKGKYNTTMIRRNDRAKRRLLKRKRQRKRNLRKLLFRYGFIEKDFMENPKNYIKNHPCKNLFYLRSEATKRLISDYELSRILYSFADKRGYSDRYDIDDKDKGVIKEAIIENNEKLKTFYTFGEMMWKLHPDKCRNSKNNYVHLATMKNIKAIRA